MVTDALRVHRAAFTAVTVKVYEPAAVGVNTGLAMVGLLRPAAGDQV